jgi:hypothetical protein
MNKEELKKQVIDFIGEEYIEKSRISKDSKGIWLYSSKFKTKPYFLHFEDIKYLDVKKYNDYDTNHWRAEFLINFREF